MPVSERNPNFYCRTVQADLGHHEYVEIMPIADLHIGDPSLNEHLLNKVIEWVNEEPYRYTVIAGDIFNAALKDSVSSVYDEKMTLQVAIDYFRAFVSGFDSPDKILAVVRGNHDNRVIRSVSLDPVATACEFAGVTYRGPEAFINIKVGNWGCKSSRVNYLMYLTHGVGGGRKLGGKVNSVLNHGSIITADITVQGHTHTPIIVPSCIYERSIDGTSILAREQLFVITTSFTGRDGYAQDFCYAPLSKKFPIIRLSGNERLMEAELKELR